MWGFDWSAVDSKIPKLSGDIAALRKRQTAIEVSAPARRGERHGLLSRSISAHDSAGDLGRQLLRLLERCRQLLQVLRRSGRRPRLEQDWLRVRLRLTRLWRRGAGP